MIALTGLENMTLTSGAPSYVLSMLADRVSYAWRLSLGTAERSTPIPEFGMRTLGDQFVDLIEGRNGLRSALRSLSIITDGGTRDLTKEEEEAVTHSIHEFDSILGEIQVLAEKYAAAPATSAPATKTSVKKVTQRNVKHEAWLSQDIFAKDVADMLGSHGFLGFGKSNGMQTFTSFLAWRRAKEFLVLTPLEGKHLHGLSHVHIQEVQNYMKSGLAAYDLSAEGKTVEALFREISAHKARVASEK